MVFLIPGIGGQHFLLDTGYLEIYSFLLITLVITGVLLPVFFQSLIRLTDLLGSCQSLPAVSSTPGPQVQPLTAGELHRELASFTQTLRSMARICLELFDSLEAMTDASRPPSSLFGTATSLLDMIHTACWEYTRWYSLYQASCPKDITAENVPAGDASS